MKFNLYFLIYLFYTGIFAQPTLNIGDFGSDIQFAKYSTIASINDMGGPNQVWDFSNLSVGGLSGFTWSVPLNSVPSAASYPEATIAQKSLWWDGTGSYNLYKTTANSYVRVVGLDLNGNVTGGSITLHTFPQLYQQTFGNSFYSGYGTVITPFGTFDNAFLITQDLTTPGQGNYHKRSTWYATNPYRVLVSEDVYCCYGPVTAFYDYSPLGIDTNSFQNVVVFVDIDNNIIVKNSQQNLVHYTIELYSLLGQNVRQFKNLKGDSVLPVTISSGIYVLKLIDSNQNVMHTKKIIIR